MGRESGKQLTGTGGALNPHSRAKINTHSGNQKPPDAKKRHSTREVEERHKGDGRIRTGKPPEAISYLGEGQGRKMGGE